MAIYPETKSVHKIISKMEWEEEERLNSAACSIDLCVCVLWTFMKATSAPICMLIFFGI